MPLLNAVQGGLRKYGQPVFDALANPSTVKTILKEPYADAEQVAAYLLGDVLGRVLGRVRLRLRVAPAPAQA